MEFHEIANIFPLMDGPEFAALVDDIKQNGLIEHIITYDNKIVDGRNRYRACVAAGVEPRFEAWRPNGVSLTKWVISKNLHRRHLTSGQRAVCALDSLPWLEREARERQVQTLKQFATDPNTQDIFDDTVPAILPERGESREQAAELFGTSARYVQDAKAIQKRRPDLIDKVRSGEMAISEAKRELVRDDVKKSLLLPTDKYRIIYADPPWKYSDTVGGCLSENYGGAEKHYPCMSIDQLCSMDVKSMTTDDAVLFMWVTSPLLEECFSVIRAWGFKYKSSFVWDKVKHNMGHYNSVRHEFLLICTKGSCTPENVKLFDSVQVIERTDKHSQKPEEFRQIIDTLYPTGNRIELFAREGAEGWSSYGNQL